MNVLLTVDWQKDIAFTWFKDLKMNFGMHLWCLYFKLIIELQVIVYGCKNLIDCKFAALTYVVCHL